MHPPPPPFAATFTPALVTPFCVDFSLRVSDIRSTLEVPCALPARLNFNRFQTPARSRPPPSPLHPNPHAPRQTKPNPPSDTPLSIASQAKAATCSIQNSWSLAQRLTTAFSPFLQPKNSSRSWGRRIWRALSARRSCAGAASTPLPLLCLPPTPDLSEAMFPFRYRITELLGRNQRLDKLLPAGNESARDIVLNNRCGCTHCCRQSFSEVKCGLLLRVSYASCGSNKMHPCEEPPRAIYPSEDGCYNVLSDRRQAPIQSTSHTSTCHICMR